LCSAVGADSDQGAQCAEVPALPASAGVCLGFRSERASTYAAPKPPESLRTFTPTINASGRVTQPVVDNSADNQDPARDQRVPRAGKQLVCGKPLARRRLVIKPYTVYGHAEAIIDVIDDRALFGSDNINGIA